jgi:hypothetical protein
MNSDLKTCESKWLCLQHTETNVMHFSFNIFRIKGLYMFRALLAHPQEALQKRHLVYCVRIMSVGCGTIAVKRVVRLSRLSAADSQIRRTTRTNCHIYTLLPPDDGLLASPKHVEVW